MAKKRHEIVFIVQIFSHFTQLWKNLLILVKLNFINIPTVFPKQSILFLQHLMLSGLLLFQFPILLEVCSLLRFELYIFLFVSCFQSLIVSSIL